MYKYLYTTILYQDNEGSILPGVRGKDVSNQHKKPSTISHIASWTDVGKTLRCISKHRILPNKPPHHRFFRREAIIVKIVLYYLVEMRRSCVIVPVTEKKLATCRIWTGHTLFANTNVVTIFCQDEVYLVSSCFNNSLVI